MGGMRGAFTVNILTNGGVTGCPLHVLRASISLAIISFDADRVPIAEDCMVFRVLPKYSTVKQMAANSIPAVMMACTWSGGFGVIIHVYPFPLHRPKNDTSLSSTWRLGSNFSLQCGHLVITSRGTCRPPAWPPAEGRACRSCLCGHPCSQAHGGFSSSP